MLMIRTAIMIMILIIPISSVIASEREGELLLNPSQINFAPQTVNSSSVPVTVNVSNIGDSLMIITSLTLQGAEQSSFILDDDHRYPVFLSPSTSIAVTIAFHPLSVNTFHAELQVLAESETTPYIVSLSGMGTSPYINSFPYITDFENSTFPPDDWWRFDSSNSASGWRRSTFGNSHTGSSYAVAGYRNGNHWLLSPAFLVTPNSNTLRFWIENSSETPDSVPTAINEYLDVLVSTSATLDTLHFSTSLMLLTNAMIPESYEEIVTNLSAFSGQVIRVAFMYHSTGGKYVYLDDFSIFQPPSGTMNPPTNLSGVVVTNNVHLSWNIPTHEANDHLSGYRIYRNNLLLYMQNGYQNTNYSDSTLAIGYYTYQVSAMYGIVESISSNIYTVEITYGIPNLLFSDSFENYPDFSISFGNWVNLDLDLSPTFNFNQISFPYMTVPKSFMVFNPNTTFPPMGSITTRSGSRMLACFDSANPPNNDWLISPPLHLGTASSFEFWAQSYTAVYGFEKFNILISTSGTDPSDFISITGADTVSVPALNWHHYQYDLSAYDGRDIRIAIQCVSDYAAVLLLDDFKVFCEDGYMGNHDENITTFQGISLMNYPNPFSHQTTIRFSTTGKSHVRMEIYNIKGQLVRRLLDEMKDISTAQVSWDGKDSSGNPVASGIYFCKISAGAHSSIRKMLLYR